MIRAWNARTGALLWKFDLVAQPGDPNNKTWEGESWKAVGGTNTWGYLTVDTERGIVYVPTSIAGENDYVGVTRPGDNLYGTALVALDIATGKRLWHQQLVHHDIWDNDLGAHPTLIDVTRRRQDDSGGGADHEDGPAVHLQSRHRRADVRHGRASGAAEHGAGREDLADAAIPAEAAAAGPQLDQAIGTADEYFGGAHGVLPGALGEGRSQDSVPYTPWQMTQDVVVFPGAIGGGNWGGVAYNKKLNLVITNVMNAGQWGHLEKSEGAPIGGDQPGVGGGRGGRGGPGAGGGPPRSREPYRKVTPEGGRFWDPKTQYSCAPTPWGELIAVNTNTGDIAWRVPLGSFDELEKKGIKAGRPSLGGGITTAGDLVFIAATTDGYFRAFDARNGAEVWSTKLTVPDTRFRPPTWARTASSTWRSRSAAVDSCAARRATKWWLSGCRRSV